MEENRNEELEAGVNVDSEIALKNQIEESEKKYLLLYADFENYKKRMQKEKEDLVTNTKVKMLQSILDMDNDIFYAMKSTNASDNDGIRLIVQKLDNFLKSQGVEAIQTETYDEDLHEVISVMDIGESKIIDVASKGYTLNGKPFRYPKIVLGK